METKSRGRSTDPNSKRQQNLAAKAARVASGETVKRGRAADPNSKNQQRLAAKAANPGRPKGRPSTKNQVAFAAQD